MRSDEIATKIRYASFIGDVASYPDYTDARLWAETNNSIMAVFCQPIVNAREGYWLNQIEVPVIANQARYRIPPRAVTGGLELVEIRLANNNTYTRIGQASLIQADNFEYPQGQTWVPAAYKVVGDQIVLLPTPNVSSQYTLRLSFYMRPNRLVTQQSSTQGAGTVRGLITAWNPTTRVATVNVIPFDQELTVPAAISTGLQTLDVIHPDGWHEVAAYSLPQTFTGLNITFGGTADVTNVAVGDYIRVAEQTDWPQLPDEFHSTLANAAATTIMLQLNMTAKAGALVSSVGADIARFKSLIEPRIKSEPQLLRAPRGIRYGWGSRFPAP